MSARNVLYLAGMFWLFDIGVAHGEIFIAPTANDKAAIPSVRDNSEAPRKPNVKEKGIDRNMPDEAADLRNKARTYNSGNVQSVPASGVRVIIQMDDTPNAEEGVLLPRGNEVPFVPRIRSQESSRDNNQTAQEIQQGGNDQIPADSQDIRIQLDKNRLKASQYMKGKAPTSQVSPANDNVVGCEGTGNVSGRIGDDSMSGREIIVIRDGRQIKMRCK